jgi:hypothetical protein
MQIRWSPAAASDLEQLFAYIRADNPTPPNGSFKRFTIASPRSRCTPIKVARAV